MATEAPVVASPAEPSPSKRAACARCQRPLRACYCASLPATPLRTRATRVVVLQHAKEQRQRHAISSVPVLAHVLDCPESVTVVPVAMGAGKGERVSEALCEILERSLGPLVDANDDDDGAHAVLVLFPHADAKTLNRELARQWWRPAATELNVESSSSASVLADMTSDDNKTKKPKSVVLVVVDGTWTEAKKIVHHSQCFWDKISGERRASGKVFEYVCLDPVSLSTATTTATGQHTGKSIYGDLRKEPMDGCVSTLEAVALALLALEPDQKQAEEIHEALCSAFRAMVEIQSQFQQHGRAQQQAKHGGTPKPKQTNSTTPSTSSSSTTTTMASGQGVVKPYVFYTTQTDFRKRQQLVQQGDVHVCTRDEAIAMCQEMNRSRKRGERVSALPQEAFERQVQDQQLMEHEK